MTLYEFILLDLNARADRCWNHGRFVTERVTESRRSLFFSVDDYYVEISLNVEGEAIAEVAAFTVGEKMERMVESMKLEDLM